MDTETPQNVDYESLGIQSNKIKLTKNSKGYGWEISLLSLDVDELVKINEKMKEAFPNFDTA